MKSFTLAISLVTLMGLGLTANGACIHPDDADFVSANGGCEDQITGYVFSRSVSRIAGGGRNWATALTFCLNLTEGGFSDWVLPTKDELLTMTQHQFVLGVNYQDVILPYASYWSSTSINNKNAWGATGLFSTVATSYSKSSSIDLVCIRNY